MSYNVGIHSFGGSAGEALDTQALVNVATLEEAKAIEEAVKTHPANTDGYTAAVITEVPETQKLEDAMGKVFECYLFDEFEWDGCEDLNDEEYYAEVVERTMDHITEHVTKFREEN